MMGEAKQATASELTQGQKLEEIRREVMKLKEEAKHWKSEYNGARNSINAIRIMSEALSDQLNETV